MFFIGIFTNQKNEMFIKKELLNIVPEDYVIFINEKNIENIKNIKFETILIDVPIIRKKNEMRKIISQCKYLVLNHDVKLDKTILKNLKLTIITYGFNGKSTFSISSIDQNDLIICLQRIICNKKNNNIEPQEFKIKNDINIDKYAIIGTEIIKIIYT